ncbi:MAG TPA: HAD-IIB family hydrolase [Clostridia bacterium]|nr:HAD-IIB family hydrolase [Clostridia bacterium]
MDMTPFEQMPLAAARDIRYILFDIDDTVTTGGKLTDEAYSAMWDLFRAGYALVPVTGRPAGWCDMIIRQWPVEAVVCENGAFALYRDGEDVIRTLTHPNAAANPRPAIEGLCRAVLAAVPGARLARDQFCRVYDAAFDFAEDEPRLPEAAVEAIMNACAAHGAKYKLSSIHVNAWYGDYDKLSMAQLYFARAARADDAKKRVLFFGDSPNDEPMFSYFPNSCGVENVRDFQLKMAVLPTYVTQDRGGAGFSRAARALIHRTGGCHD